MSSLIEKIISCKRKNFGMIVSLGQFHEHFCVGFSLKNSSLFMANGERQTAHRFIKF
jgi:hypothetical protein